MSQEEYNNGTNSRYPKFNPLENDEPVYRSICPVGVDAKPVYRSATFTDASAREGDFRVFLLKNKNRAMIPTTQAKVEVDINGNAKIVAPVLPGAPFPVNHYHFHCRTGANTIVKMLGEVLTGSEVDFEFKENKCKFKAVCYVQHGSIDFNVRVYQTKLPGLHLVEFQRLGGDIMAWDQVYSHIYMQMATLIDRDEPSSSQSTGQKQICAAMNQAKAVSAGQSAAVRNAIKPLVAMICSNYVESQIESTLALARASDNLSLAKVLIEEGAVDALLPRLSSMNINVRRCAVSSIANLAKVLLPEEMRSLCVMSKWNMAVRSIVSLLRSPSCDACVELQRECVRALRYLSVFCREEVTKSGGVALLQVKSRCSDSRLAVDSQSALNKLAAV